MTIVYRALAASAVFLTLGLSGCATKDAGGPHAVSPELLAFENAYVQTLHYQSPGGVKLIGYKTLAAPPDEVAEFEKLYDEHRARIPNYYLDRANKLVRVYFPVESALVELDGGRIFAANALGELDLSPTDPATRGLGVVGRPQTDKIRGVDSNIIKDGTIYLSQKNLPVHSFGQTYVFDFGIKMLVHEDEAAAVIGGGGYGGYGGLDGGYGGTTDGGYGGTTDGGGYGGLDGGYGGVDGGTPDGGDGLATVDGMLVPACTMSMSSSGVMKLSAACYGGRVSCIPNHGGVNCSVAFGIPTPRCPFVATVCMDYNGWFTDCVRGGSWAHKLSNFPGSDCDYALGAGHCWNELM